jgi:hypothetical protein
MLLLLVLLGAAGWRHGAGAAAPGGALSLPAPQGEVLLTVSGAILRGNARDEQGRLEARFDRIMLERLGTTEVVTGTPWHTGKVRFEGVALRVLFDAVGVQGSNVRAVAHNEYSATLPVSDATRYPVILATKANGEAMTLRNKGPLFVIYPFDSDRALHTDMVYLRSVWQLRRLDVY